MEWISAPVTPFTGTTAGQATSSQHASADAAEVSAAQRGVTLPQAALDTNTFEYEGGDEDYDYEDAATADR